MLIWRVFAAQFGAPAMVFALRSASPSMGDRLYLRMPRGYVVT